MLNINQEHLKLYKPIIIIYIVSIIATIALVQDLYHKEFYIMHYFMGMFLLIFSILKLFDINDFANNFVKYDIISQKNIKYAKAYPFIELFLSYCFLSAYSSNLLYLATCIIMGVGTFSIYKYLKTGQTTKCACIGKFFDLPLGKVSLFENITMFLMSLILLFF